MLTVIIAERVIIDQLKKYDMLLSPFDDQNVAFCEWNCDGSNVDEMLPDLYDLISFNKSWRAIVVSGRNRDSLNPFDFAKYQESGINNSLITYDDNFIPQFMRRFDCYKRAAENPMTKLSVALCEEPLFADILEPEAFESIISGKISVKEYTFRKLYSQLNLKKITALIRRYRLKYLNSIIPEEKTDSFLDVFENGKIDDVLDMLPEEKFEDFLKLANCGEYSVTDPGYWMGILDNTARHMLLKDLTDKYNIKAALPEEVICVSLRSFDTRIHNSKVAWEDKTEQQYSDFARYNLYNENLRFLLYDITQEDRNNYTNELLKFHTLICILAMHGNAASTIMKSKLYKIDLDYDEHDIQKGIAEYIIKLKNTAKMITEQRIELSESEIAPVSNEVSRAVFESEFRVPVKLDSEYNKDSFMAEHKLGLSTDCPGDEYSYWVRQYDTIKKKFKRFLREPRRAVKKACIGDFHENSSVDDPRALGLNENQKEDILIKIGEEETEMVNIVTSGIYDSERYNEEMDRADKEVKRKIGQRMTRGKTLAVAGIVIAAYLFGFIPILLSNANNAKSFIVSLIVSASAIGIVMAVGFIYLFVLRKRLVDRFKHFNDVMSGIHSEITASLDRFSDYLSHACSIMRQSAVLEYAETEVSEEDKTDKIMKYNLMQIEKLIADSYTLYNRFTDTDVFDMVGDDIVKNIDVFDLDYTVPQECNFPIYGKKSESTIEYMLKGYNVDIPVSYVSAVKITREELYD